MHVFLYFIDQPLKMLRKKKILCFEVNKKCRKNINSLWHIKCIFSSLSQRLVIKIWETCTCIVIFNVKLQPVRVQPVHISTKYAKSFLTKFFTPRQHFSKSLNDRNWLIAWRRQRVDGLMKILAISNSMEDKKIRTCPYVLNVHLFQGLILLCCFFFNKLI